MNDSATPNRFAGRVAIVTGGAGGIGEGIVKRLLQEGAAAVWVADIQFLDESVCIEAKRRLETTARPLQQVLLEPFYLKVDVSSEGDIQRFITKVTEKSGKLDVLINNAACFVFQAAEEVSEEGLNRSFAVNVRGPALMSKHAAAVMARPGVPGKREGGAIVNISSISSQIAQPGFLPYSMSKGAIAQMTRNQALDFGKFGIRVNAVNPGPVWTQGTERQAVKEGRTVEEMVNVLKSNLVVNRMGTPADVAAAVAFLASDEASFITGASLTVDGGYTIQ